LPPRSGIDSTHAGAAVPISAAFSAVADRSGQAWRINAATPATRAADSDVPSKAADRSPGPANGAMTPYPGALRSGFATSRCPSAARSGHPGPRALKCAAVSMSAGTSALVPRRLTCTSPPRSIAVVSERAVSAAMRNSGRSASELPEMRQVSSSPGGAATSTPAASAASAALNRSPSGHAVAFARIIAPAASSGHAASPHGSPTRTTTPSTSSPVASRAPSPSGAGRAGCLPANAAGRSTLSRPTAMPAGMVAPTHSVSG